MPTARKLFNCPFLLEKSKLTRLLEVIESRFKQAHIATPQFAFGVELPGQKVIETESIDEVLSLDNSKRSRIQGLSITCRSSEGTAEPHGSASRPSLLIDFDGTGKPAIMLTVRGDKPTWVSETFSAAEEQIERTQERSILTRLAHHNITSVLLMALTAIVLASFIAFSSSVVPTRLTNSMWLSDEDLRELQLPQPDTKPKADEVLSRQIRNITEYRRQRQSLFGRVTQPRFILIVVPGLIVLGAFAYVYFMCYPQAVFLWGDAEDWYKKILNQRRLIWSSIIIALGVGILANLFLLGIHS